MKASMGRRATDTLTLNPTRDGDEWSASWPWHFMPGRKRPWWPL